MVDNIVNAFGETLGSTTSLEFVRGLEKGVNGEKGRLMRIYSNGKRQAPVAPARLLGLIRESIATGANTEEWLEEMRSVSSSYSAPPLALVAGKECWSRY